MLIIENVALLQSLFFFRINIKYSLPGVYLPKLVHSRPWPAAGHMAAASYLISSPVENYWAGAQREKRRAKNMGEVRGEKALPKIFSLAVFWAMPQLAERLEEAKARFKRRTFHVPNLMLLLSTWKVQLGSADLYWGRLYRSFRLGLSDGTAKDGLFFSIICRPKSFSGRG